MDTKKHYWVISSIWVAIAAIIFWQNFEVMSLRGWMKSAQLNVSSIQTFGVDTRPESNPVLRGEIASGNPKTELPRESEQVSFDGKVAMLSAPNTANLQSLGIFIPEFQVTQGIQSTGNNPDRVPLVRDANSVYKEMLVRVATYTTSTTPITVTVIAHIVSANGSAQKTSQISSLPTVLATQPISLSSEHAISMSLPSLRLVHGATLLTATVEISPVAPSAQPSKLSNPITYAITSLQTPQIFYYPLRFPDEIQPVSTTIRSMSAAGFVKGITPVADSVDLYRSVPYNTLHCPVIEVYKDTKISDQSGYTNQENDRPDIPSEACVVLHHLASLRNGLATCGYGPDPYTFVYGWVNDDPNAVDSVILDNGYASQSGRVGFGNTLARRGQRTFAHELTHMVGMKHKEDGLNDLENQLIGWDSLDWLLKGEDIWTTNQVTQSLKPTSLYDIRIPGKDTNQAWIERDTYADLLARLSDPQLLPQSDCLDDLISPLFAITSTFASELNLRQVSSNLLGEFSSHGESLDTSNPITVVIIHSSQSWLVDDLQNVYLIRNNGVMLNVFHMAQARASVESQYCVVPDADSASGYVAIPFPTYIWPWTLQPPTIQDSAGEIFTLTIDIVNETQSTVALTTTFDARIGADPNEIGRDLLYGFFSAAIPYSDTQGAITVTRVAITAPNGLPVPILDRVTGSYGNELVNRNQPFAINITSPSQPTNGNESTDAITLTEQSFNIQWSVIDPSGRNPDLFEYQVLYSHNAGQIWTPLAVNLPNIIQEITITSDELCRTQNRFGEGTVGIIRVLASDGLNTAKDDLFVFWDDGVQLTSIYCARGTNRTPTVRVTSVPTPAPVPTPTPVSIPGGPQA